MNRLLSLFVFTATSLLLFACSNQESMDGEYYEIGDYGY